MSRFFPQYDRYFAPAKRPDIAVTRHIVRGAPKWMRGLSVLFASDFHMRPEMDVDSILKAMTDERYDLILLGGDFADRKADALQLFDAFSGLHAPLGIFAVRGNNDTEAFGDVDALREAVRAFGGRLLVNESVCVDCGGGRLWIGGVDEPRHGTPEYSKVFGQEAGYRILLSHYPTLPPARDIQPDLMLSGHTHGGQFNAFGLTPYAIGFEQIGGKKHLAPAMVCGQERFGSMELIVSKGIGASRIQLRVGVRPEVHSIRLEC